MIKQAEHIRQLLMVGSSIFQQWPLPPDLIPNWRIVNRAVGGTTTRYWVQHLPAVLDEIKPECVMVYCGSNDLNCQVKPQRIMHNLLTIRRLVSSVDIDPPCRMVWTSIIRAPQKQCVWDQVDWINQQIAQAVPQRDLFVDFNTLLCPDGVANPVFFQTDQLHLTEPAYRQMNQRIIDLLRPWLAPPASAPDVISEP